jgi:predicted Zn-dependent protease
MQFKHFFLLKKAPLELSQFIEDVLKPSFQEYTDFVKEIEVGTLTFEKFEQHIRIQTPHFSESDKINKKWADYFKVSMKSANFPDKIMDQRFRQFDLYLELKNINNIVTVLIDIKNKNGLTKNYEFLENLAQSVIRFYIRVEKHFSRLFIT